MPRGENVINMTVEAEFLQLIRKYAGEQYDNTFMGKCILEFFLQKGWVTKETFDKLIETHWGLTIVQQNERNKKRKLEEKEKKALDTATKAKQAEADLIKAKAYYKQVTTTQDNREWEIIDNLVGDFKEGMQTLKALPFKDKKEQVVKIRAILDKLAKLDPEKALELESTFRSDEKLYLKLGDKGQ